MVAASASFFAAYYGGKLLFPAYASSAYVWNNVLWSAFMVYLTLRGVLQALMLKKSIYNQVQ